MIIAIDYDGTFMAFPVLYKNLFYAFKGAGWEVGILTGRTNETIDEDEIRLADYGVTPDFFLNLSLMTESELEIERMIANGHIYMDRAELVCSFKARVCQQWAIDVLFDDAADKIRLFLSEGCNTYVFKSPTEHNMVVKKWGKAHRVEYK